MALLSYTDFKILADISGTAEDAKLALLEPMVDSAVKDFLDRDIEVTTYPGAATSGQGDSGYYSGNGSRYLTVRQYPIRTVTTIHEDASGRWGQNPDGSFATANLLVAGTDYAVRWDGSHGAAPASFCGIIERIGGHWTETRWRTRGTLLANEQQSQGTIKIAYSGGYTTIPPAIKEAAYLLMAHYRRIADKGGNVTSESLGSYSYALGGAAGKVSGLPAEVVRLLLKYKRVSL